MSTGKNFLPANFKINILKDHSLLPAKAGSMYQDNSFI